MTTTPDPERSLLSVPSIRLARLAVPGALIVYPWLLMSGCEDQFGALEDDGGGGEAPGDGDGDGDLNSGGAPNGDGDAHSEVGGLGGDSGGDGDAGEISCDDNQIVCAGSCVDPQIDPDHCGAVSDCAGKNEGQECEDDELCQQGECLLDCPDGLIDCQGECVDPLFDNLFCGAYGECATESELGDYCDNEQACIAGECRVWTDFVSGSSTEYAPFDAEVVADGTMIWARTKSDQDARYTLFDSDGSAQTYDVELESQSTLDLAATLEPSTGTPVVAQYFGAGWSVAFLEGGAVTGGNASPSDPTDFELVAQREGDRVAFIRNDNYFSPGQLGANIFDSVGDLNDSFVVGSNTDEIPDSVDWVRDVMMAGWGSSDSKEARVRLIQDQGVCCDSIVINSSEASIVERPSVGMDLAQNSFAVWSEAVGARVVRAIRFIPSDKSPDLWEQKKWKLDGGLDVDATAPALAIGANGHGVAAWLREDSDGRRIAYRFYNPKVEGWTDVGELSGHSVAENGASLGLSVNEQGLAVLAWVENKNTLWVSVSVPHGSGFGEPQRIASATGDIDGLKVRITFDGRAAVFWREGGAFGEAKALRLERPGGGWGLK